MKSYCEKLESVSNERYEKEEGDKNWIGCLCLLCPPLSFFVIPYWIWQGYQKGR